MTASASLRRKTIALVGLMGVGKSSIGRRLAHALDMTFIDADSEIEKAAGCSISEIFERLGEPSFREGERRVISRLIDETPHVLATGGGAFMNTETRALLKQRTVTVWLKADIEVLARRVSRKDTRPLLTGRDPVEVLTAQAAERYPIYAQADLAIETGDTAHQVAVEAILGALTAHLEAPAT
jgi:shikimate kinase